LRSFLTDHPYSKESLMPEAETDADKIRTECGDRFAANSDDCNKFVKAVARRFFEPDLFTGNNMTADKIIETMGGAGWTQLGKIHSSAIAKAKAGRFVVAGMTSGELGDTNGHLAIVVGDDGMLSGTVTVPICYAGGLNVAARVERQRVSATFGAAQARESKISYFCRDIQTS
jgi:hypothetical protein